MADTLKEEDCKREYYSWKIFLYLQIVSDLAVQIKKVRKKEKRLSFQKQSEDNNKYYKNKSFYVTCIFINIYDLYNLWVQNPNIKK